MRTREIVVGTDGSPGGDRAVRWAVREAASTGSAVRVLTVFDWNAASGRLTGGVTARQMAESESDIVLADARLIAERVHPGSPVRYIAQGGHPVPVLVQAARRASLLVVGDRGRTGLTGVLLGSVGERVAVHAPCPVAVVRSRADEREGPIVVGVDGGADASTVLTTAFEMASGRGTMLSAIHAYAEPAALWGSTVPPLVFDPVRMCREATAALLEELRPWREKFPSVAVEARAVAGSASAALLEASHTAQALVVGSGSHSVIGGVLTGSVALRMLSHAGCPVVVARDGRT